MSSLSRPRGPLPPRVYWTRRLVVLGLAVALTVGIARLLTLGSDASAPDQAQQAGAEPSVTSSPSASTTQKAHKKRKKDKPTPTAPPLAEPTGECTSSDVVVVPEVNDPVGGSDVLIALELRTRIAEACTWTVSADTVTLKITSGRDDIWSSRQCPVAIPNRAVVVRREVGTKVGVIWEEARRSDADCSGLGGWALPGYYHAVAAALGGEPSDLQFELSGPPRPVVTRTVTPSPEPKQPKKPKHTDKPKNP